MTHRPSLVAGWVAGWRERPDRTVLVEASSGTEWTGSRLDRVTADITRVLLARGVRPGDHVVLSAAPSAATVTAFVAVLRAGAVVVPVSTEATRRELEHVVATVGASVAVADAPDRFAALAEAYDVDALQVERAQPPASPSDVAFDAAGPESRALVCFTSGTTGQPKGAPLTHGNVETCCARSHRRVALDPGRRPRVGAAAVPRPRSRRRPLPRP